ncbi:MAG: hypothetical protein Q8R47_02320 [Nanoarchaeota archaeon]|nr:hypothetical protein [Nanoarchaeota archaeon]
MYHGSQYSGLEYITRSTSNYTSSPQAFYSISAPPASYNDGMFIPSRDAIFSYSSIEKEKLSSYPINKENYNFISIQPEYYFVPDTFLKPGKEGAFVGKAEEVREFVEEAFEKICHQEFPANIKMSILNQEEFSKIAPSSGTIGLSLNRGQQGLLSEIFILNDTLGRVMLTIGHELGHVLTKTLPNQHDEEAKAYAFSLLWMKIIQEHNIADLGEAIITEHPAENGLHNLAFSFIHQLLSQGKEIEEIYAEIIAEAASFHGVLLIP